MLKKYGALMLASGMLVAASASAQTAKKTTATTKKTTTTQKAGTTKAGATKTGGTKAAPVKAATGFTKGENDLDYKVITKGTGTVSPQIGDAVEVHIFQQVGDSLLMNSYVGNGGKPISFKIQEVPVKGDLMEGIKRMKVGDSTVFRIPLDTVVSRYQQQMPPWAAKGSYLTWGVKLVSIKPKAEVDAEEQKAQEAQREAMEKAKENAAAQAVIDDSLIVAYMKAKGVTGYKKTASGLYYVVTKPGEGPNVTVGQKATVNYSGRNINDEAFDSNVDPAFNHVSPFEFPVGQHQVIAGWDEGVALMNKGEKATFYIPSGLAYGPNARAEKIPANAVLIFDIELVSMQ